ncbi:MAG: ECF transporter S component [Anaerolineae bacterium]
MNNGVITWLAVRIAFAILLALAHPFTDGERFSRFALITTISFCLLVSSFGLQRATAKSYSWEAGTREVIMTLGAAPCVPPSFIVNAFLRLSVGQVELRPTVCIPVLFSYVFGPVVSFFTGAVANLLGDFVIGWGVFPAWPSAAD